MSSVEHTITLVRTIRASASDLYRAWTDPVIMKRWLADVVEADVQVGGTYRLEIHAKDGSFRELSGNYLVLEPYTRVAITYSDIDIKPGLHLDEQVEVKLRKLASAITELTLTHGWNGRPMTDAERDALGTAWSSWLEKLIAGVELPGTLEG